MKRIFSFFDTKLPGCHRAPEQLGPVVNLKPVERFDQMQPWTELKAFALHMQARLEEKETDPKKMGKSWRSTPMIELEEELRNQVLQLGYAFRRNDKELIRKKAVDVANYCMMIYDNLDR